MDESITIALINRLKEARRSAWEESNDHKELSDKLDTILIAIINDLLLNRKRIRWGIDASA